MGEGRIDGTILTEGGWIAGHVAHGARVERIEGQAVSEPAPPYVLPGFVDAHVHGGGGGDVMAGADGLAAALRLHARHGTTAMCPTSVTAPYGETEAFLRDVAAAMAAPVAGGARVLGAHLEGPFLNPGKLGAQPPHAVAPDVAAVRRWVALAPVRVMTFAPEMAGADALLEALLEAGVRPQIGHTLCDYATARGAIARGCGATHLFNAMGGLAHRGNGAAGAVLAHGDWAEVIPDLLHVEAGAILAARRAVPNLYGVTDATAGAGMPDGTYALGGQAVEKRGGAMRLGDGTLAGSALTMDVALRNLVGIGLPLMEAARRLSTLPADWLRCPEVGRLMPGAHADAVVMDADLRVVRVVIGGRDVEV